MLSHTYNGLGLARLTLLWDGGEGRPFVSLPTLIKPKNGQKILMKVFYSVLYFNNIWLDHTALQLPQLLGWVHTYYW